MSSIAVLLACVPLLDALRRSGPKRVANLLVAPLAFLAVVNLAQAIRYCLGSARAASADVSAQGLFFWPGAYVGYVANTLGFDVYFSPPGVVVVAEAVKWCVVLLIAMWLSVAQAAAWRLAARHK